MKTADLLPIEHNERLNAVVMLSWKILQTRFTQGRHRIPTEAPFQHYFGHILSIIGESFCMSREDKFVVDLEERILDIKDKSKFIDIVCGFQNSNTYCAIELKFKKKSQGAQDFGRIDSYVDIEAVELAIEKKKYAMGFFFIITDSTAYVNPSRIGVGTIFPMHDGASVAAGSFTAIHCKGREGVVVTLRDSYSFGWEKSGDWYFMCVPIKKTEPNKALEPTTMPVTFRAYARTAPGMVAAQF
jgi:hypothetical protein